MAAFLTSPYFFYIFYINFVQVQTQKLGYLHYESFNSRSHLSMTLPLIPSNTFH